MLISDITRCFSVAALMGGRSEAYGLIGAGNDGFAFDATDLSLWIRDSGTPANNVNYAGNLKNFSAPFTYTSPSPKLIRHADGLIKYNAHNLYLNSASPANQSITVVAGATYAVTITGTVSVTASGAATGTWTAGTNTFTAATTTLTLGSTSGSGTVHVYRTPADSTYVATAGSVKYLLPVEYDADGAALGVLIEPQATNLERVNIDLDNPVYHSIYNVSITETATSPSGMQNAATLTNTLNSGSDARQISSIGMSVSASTTHTVSVYAKAGTHSYISLGFYWDADNYAAAVFDLSGGASATQEVDGSSSPGALVSTMQTDVGNGWHRLSLTFTTGGSASAGSTVISFANAATGNSFYAYANASSALADGLTLSIWRPQVEVGAVATSPIETYAASVTRAGDYIAAPTGTFPADADEGTLYFDVTETFISDQPRGVVAILGYFLGLSTTTVRAYLYTTDYVFGNIQAAKVNDKAAFAWALDDAVLYNGGTVIGTDTSGTPADPSSADLRIGTDGGFISRAHIKAVMYRPTRLANATLEALTT